MKTIYAILLLVCFVLVSEAQSNTTRPVPLDSTSAIIKDSTTLSASDSIGSSVKDSINKLCLDSIAAISSKTLFGVASFYSRNLEGTKTATGETFCHANYTAASNNFKLNTWVRVTNMRNGESVIVRINDRMHPKMARKGRVVDLTSSAAKKIGLTGKVGVLKVKVEQVAKDTND